MADKMIMCLNPETGIECEMPERVTKDAGHMKHLGMVVKPQIQKLSTKEVQIKLSDAKTVEEINIIMEGEQRPDCISSAEKMKTKLTEIK